MKSLNDIAIEHYNKIINNVDPCSSSAVSFPNKDRIIARYTHIKKHIQKNDSVLDVGCGNGKFFEYLSHCNHSGEYKGVDINENLISAAKKTYSNSSSSFQVCDIMVDQCAQKYDCVCLCGVFNDNFGQSIEWVQKFIQKMYHLSNKKVIFNAISTYVNTTHGSMFYINPTELLKFIIENISTNVTVEHDMVPYNFQIVINKQQNRESLNLPTESTMQLSNLTHSFQTLLFWYGYEKYKFPECRIPELAITNELTTLLKNQLGKNFYIEPECSLKKIIGNNINHQQRVDIAIKSLITGKYIAIIEVKIYSKKNFQNEINKDFDKMFSVSTLDLSIQRYLIVLGDKHFPEQWTTESGQISRKTQFTKNYEYKVKRLLRVTKNTKTDSIKRNSFYIGIIDLNQNFNKINNDKKEIKND